MRVDRRLLNAVTIPIGMYLINLGQAKDRAKLSAAATTTAKGEVTVKAPKADVAVDPSKDASKDKNAEVMVSKSSNMGKKKNSNLAALVNALKQPVCWAPLLAIVLVLIGVRTPAWPCSPLVWRFRPSSSRSAGRRSGIPSTA